MYLPMRSPLVALFLSVGLLFGQAKKPAKKTTVAAPVAEAPGQWILGTVGVGKHKDGTIDSTGLKGLAVRLGEDGKKGIAYDLDLCRPIGAWSGKFTTEMNLMSRGDYPTAMGETIFVTGDFAGLMPGADATSLAPRKGFGPLPAGQARFKGFHNAGRSVVVRWDVGGVALDETAEVVTANEVQFIVRTLEVAPSAKGVTIMLGKSEDAGRIVTLGASKVDQIDGHAVARVDGSKDVTTVRIAYLPAGVPLPQSFDTDTPSMLLKVAKTLWPETVETTGKLSEKSGEAYVVDDVKLPVVNPWKAPMFTSAFDFLPDGRAVISTFHGDVFIASGIDDKLEKVTWRRFASFACSQGDVAEASLVGKCMNQDGKRVIGLAHIWHIYLAGIACEDHFCSFAYSSQNCFKSRWLKILCFVNNNYLSMQRAPAQKSYGLKR